MPNFKTNGKGVVLLIVLGVVLVVTFLAAAILTIMSSHSRLTHHQVSRIKAYYTGKGMMNYVLDKMRTDSVWQPHATETHYACYRGCIDATATATVGLDMPVVDADILYKVQVTIYPLNVDPKGKINIKTDYTYTL
ncbi:MAG: hypothetical protein Q7K98_03600 [Candidatus Omnitrophota bacterium]|nr:hypothetical protein [Candidatus Omnitrophota bacterium]